MTRYQQLTLDLLDLQSGDAAFGRRRSGRAAGDDRVRADAGNMTRLTDHKKIDQHSTWSPDGNGLAYAGKMAIGDDGELVANSKGRPVSTYDIYLVPSAGFAIGDATERPILPINLMQTDGRDGKSPSWRP